MVEMTTTPRDLSSASIPRQSGSLPSSRSSSEPASLIVSAVACLRCTTSDLNPEATSVYTPQKYECLLEVYVVSQFYRQTYRQTDCHHPIEACWLGGALSRAKCARLQPNGEPEKFTSSQLLRRKPASPKLMGRDAPRGAGGARLERAGACMTSNGTGCPHV